MSVLIALLSLPLVSVALGSVGRAPLLEDISRGLLGVIGLWILLRQQEMRLLATQPRAVDVVMRGIRALPN